MILQATPERRRLFRSKFPVGGTRRHAGDPLPKSSAAGTSLRRLTPSPTIRFGFATRGKMRVRGPYSSVPILLVIAALAGCAGNAPQLQSLSVEQPTDAPPSAGVTSLSGNNGEPPGVPVPGAIGSATDVYAHIARGAMACWFAVNGPLKKDYIFHAAADAPSRGNGGKAVITIHLRDPSQANPRGLKAYIAEIQPTGAASATVRVENRKMPETYAAAMTDDISRWSKGEQGCTGSSSPANWAPKPIEAVAEAPKTTKKSKKSKKVTRTQATKNAQAQP